MTIEVTQEDRERADWWLMQMDGPDYERLCLDFARHRQAAYEKGGRDAIERLTGLGGGS